MMGCRQSQGAVLLAVALVAAAVIVGGCGSAASSPAATVAVAASPAAASPIATPVASAPAAAPSGTAAGGSPFRYELKGAVTGTVDSGRVTFNSNVYEHVVLFVEGSLMPKYDVTLYFPLDLAAGTHTLAPFKEIVEKGRISATSSTLDGVFYATSGTLTVTSMQGGVMSGTFDFDGTDRADSSRSVHVAGSFEGVTLPTV
jgi:hypothetical protein